MESAHKKLQNQLSNSLLRKGYHISKQREIIIEALCKEQEIKNIELFWLNLRREHAISYATVYKNIGILLQHGWLVKEGQNVADAVYRLSL